MCFVLLALIVSGQSLANTTNSVSKAFSFEEYADGQDLAGTNGWYGEAGAIVAVATNQPYSGERPLPDPHDRIASLTGPVTNLFDGNPATTNVWMDVLLQPRRWQQEEPPSEYPTDAQVVLYVDTNGYLNALCTFFNGTVYTNEWAMFEQISFDTNEWLRLTLALKYQAAYSESYFQIQVNNSEFLTNTFGQTVPGAYDAGGSWFLCVDKSATEFNALSFSGNSQIDDLVLTNEAPAFTPLHSILVAAGDGSEIAPAGPVVLVVEGEDSMFTITADDGGGYVLTNLWWGTGMDAGNATNPIPITNALSMAYTFQNVSNDFTIKSETARPAWDDAGETAAKGTKIAWLYLYDLDYYATPDDAEDGNDDTDPALNWQEHVAGTIPTDGDSYFHVLDTGYGSPSNYVMYYVTTNSGVSDPIDIYRSIDLTATDGGWTLVGDDIARDHNGGNGTSKWWDVNAPSNTPAYYLPIIEWPFP